MTETGSDLGRALSAVAMTAVAILILDWRLALFVLLIVPGTVLISHRVAHLRETPTCQRWCRKPCRSGVSSLPVPWRAART